MLFRSLSLSEFLKVIMYYQCANGGNECGGAIYETNFDSKEAYIGVLNSIVADFEKVIEHNGLVIYQKEGKLVWHFTDKEGNVGDIIFASTQTEQDLRELDIYGFVEL